MDTKAIHRARGLGLQLARRLNLDAEDCMQEAVCTALEVHSSQHFNGWACPDLWRIVHLRLIGARGALRYLQPVGLDAPVRLCRETACAAAL